MCDRCHQKAAYLLAALLSRPATTTPTGHDDEDLRAITATHRDVGALLNAFSPSITEEPAEAKAQPVVDLLKTFSGPHLADIAVLCGHWASLLEDVNGFAMASLEGLAASGDLGAKLWLLTQAKSGAIVEHGPGKEERTVQPEEVAKITKPTAKEFGQALADALGAVVIEVKGKPASPFPPMPKRGADLN